MGDKQLRLRTRVLASMSLVFAISTGFPACAQKEVQEKMTAREGRDTVVQFVLDSTTRPSVTGWWPRNGVAWAQECALSGNELGATYAYEHWAARGNDPVTDAKVVAQYWDSLGMSVRTTNPNGSPNVYAEGGPVLRASFVTFAAEGSYRIGAVMPCGTGDAGHLNDEDNTKREQGEVLLGDEGIVIREDPRVVPTPDDSSGQAEERLL